MKAWLNQKTYSNTQWTNKSVMSRSISISNKHNYSIAVFAFYAVNVYLAKSCPLCQFIRWGRELLSITYWGSSLPFIYIAQQSLFPKIAFAWLDCCAACILQFWSNIEQGWIYSSLVNISDWSSYYKPFDAAERR